MGLDATVSCNCFKEGRTTAPPVPDEWIYLDSDGHWSCREQISDSDFVEFYRWKETCCAHKQMNFASVHIANWAGYRLFQEALGKVGWMHFPTLQRELPNANGGLTDSASSKEALLELEWFRGQSAVGENTSLIDTATGHVIFEHVAAYDGVFIFGDVTRLEAGVGKAQFFIRDKESMAIRFQAVRVRQQLLDPIDENQWYKGRVEFVDLDTMQTFVCQLAVSGAPKPWPDGRLMNHEGRMRFSPSDAFHVEIRTVAPSHFDYSLGPLTSVFEASVTTGNPVRWC